MKKRESSIVEGIVGSRRNVIEIIVVAVLLAFGVNLISGQIPVSGSRGVAVAGFLLCIISILYLTFRLLRIENRTYEAFFIYNRGCPANQS
jgi:hypothetical protein